MTTSTEDGTEATARPVVYTAQTAPAGTQCSREGCLQPALVRLYQVGNAGARDYCGPDFRDARESAQRDGHTGHDGTGDLGTLRAEYPDWQIEQRGDGRLFAWHGATTVSAWLCGPLRIVIRASISAWA